MSRDQTRWGVGDLETDPFEWQLEVKPFAAGWLESGTLLVWWGENAVRDFLKHLRNRQGIVYFHNGGKFDLHHLLPFMETKDIDPEPVVMGSRTISLKWRGIEFRDSYAIVPKPLRSWAKDDIKIWKLKAEHREKYKDEIISYLKGDLRYLHDMLGQMFEKYGRALTLASLTFRIMERDFGIKPIHTPRSFDRRFRNHYFAGRVQFWQLGRVVGNFRILDINSAFPRAMLEEHWWSAKFKENYNEKQKIVGPGMYEVDCLHSGGALARRTKDGIEFPVDGGVFFTTGWELLAGQASGAIRDFRVLCGCVPKKLQSFRAYVLHFYSLKEEAKDPADRYFAKLILNSFYGKLAQNEENFRQTFIAPYREWPKGKGWELIADDKASGRSIFQRPSPGRSDPYCVAAGASITGWVRAELHKVIVASKRVLYCDTDSLICEKPATSVHVGKKLGDWKEEMKCDVVWIAGKKLYCAHNRKFGWHKIKPVGGKHIHVEGLGWTSLDPEAWKTASKGVRLSVAELIAVAEGKSRTARQAAPSYGLGRGPRFISRQIRRADKRQ